jgi:hypothetical protein
MIRYVTVLVLSMFAFGARAQNSPPHHQLAAPKGLLRNNIYK